MKAILKTIMAGPRGNHYPGDIVDDSDGSLVSGGFADPVEKPKKEELHEDLQPAETDSNSEEAQQSDNETRTESETGGNAEDGNIEPAIEQAAESAEQSATQGKSKKAR